jgi:uncharacterized repeat protein (TIGR03803 family)
MAFRRGSASSIFVTVVTFFTSLLGALLCVSSAFAGTEKVIHNFTPYLNGGNPKASLVADAQGNLYGTASDGGTYGGGVVFKLTPTASGPWTETILHNFEGGTSDGYDPQAGLVFDKAGNLYGTTSLNCELGHCSGGTVFELSPNSNGSWTETILHWFISPTDGSRPEANLIFDSAGNLYGTTFGGGRLCYCGTVFELSPMSNGTWQETILYSFAGQSDGDGPMAGLTFDSAGNLYGTTSGLALEITSYGTVFKLSPSSGGGWTLTTIHEFRGTADGQHPEGGVIFDSAGNLYGTTYGSGPNDSLVYELSPSADGSWKETLLSSSVINAVGNLVFDSAGNLYGAESEMAAGFCCGSIFEVTPTATLPWQTRSIYSFGGGLDGQAPSASVIMDSAGNLYGTTIVGGGLNDCSNGLYGQVGCGTVFKLSQPSAGNWSETQLYDFVGSDGLYPSSLVTDGQGNYYGTTYIGGAYGSGEVFKTTQSSGTWVTTTLYNFTGLSDGGYPEALTLDSEGNLYGTAGFGGVGVSSLGTGCGVIFELTPGSDGSWNESVLYAFQGKGKNDGCYPTNAPVFDSSGNLYGTTSSGGETCEPGDFSQCGTIWELQPTGTGSWNEILLHEFSSTPLGVGAGAIVIDGSGNLYGVSGGGPGCGDYAKQKCDGLIYQMSPGADGWTYKVIYDFLYAGGITDPVALVIDAAGNLYGTALNGGGFTSCGEIFELSPAGTTWNLSTLHSFSGTNDGCLPVLLTLDANGSLYGATGFATTYYQGFGTVFELSPSGSSWTLNTFYTFTGAADGGNPSTNVVLDSAGNIYGGGSAYWNSGTSTLYEVTP